MPTTPRSKWDRILAWLIILTGMTLLIYMISVEGEPGALPLFLIIAGTAWLLATRYRIKKDRRKP